MTAISKAKLAKLATIAIEYEPEDLPIAELDKETAAWVRAELARGNTWAWCTVIVWASYDGLRAHSAPLRCCSYRDERAFRVSGYLTDMRREALDVLHTKLVERDREQAAEQVSQPVVVEFTGGMAIVTRYERRKIRVRSSLGHGAYPWDPARTASENHCAAAIAFAERYGLLARCRLVAASLPPKCGYVFIPVPK